MKTEVPPGIGPADLESAMEALPGYERLKVDVMLPAQTADMIRTIISRCPSEPSRKKKANPAPATSGPETTPSMDRILQKPSENSEIPVGLNPLEGISDPSSEIIHIDIPWSDSEDVATFATTNENGQFGYETRSVLGIVEKKFCNRNGYGSRQEAITAGVAQMRTHLQARIGNASGAVLNHAREFDEKLAELEEGGGK